MAEQFIEQQVAEFARRYPTAAAIPAAKDAPAPVKKASAGPVAKEAETRPNVIQLECTNFAKQRKRHPDDNIASSDSDSDSTSEYSDSESDDSCECSESTECDFHFTQRANASRIRKK
jgi:hypothetical protein